MQKIDCHGSRGSPRNDSVHLFVIASQPSAGSNNGFLKYQFLSEFFNTIA
jgi:hypothetical protein